MFKRYLCTGIACIFCFASFAKTNEGKVYKFTINLINVTNDKIKVELLAPSIAAATITYHIPKIVPGTYSADDYGRYIEQFKAYDKKGDTLQVVKSDVNSWTISDAKKLYKIDYLVNDSYRLLQKMNQGMMVVISNFFTGFYFYFV